MNDSQVSLVPLSKVLNCQAYILLYSKNPTAQAAAVPLSKPVAPSTTSSSTSVPVARGANGKADKLPESVPSSLGTVDVKPMKQNNLAEKDSLKSAILDIGEPVTLSDLPLRQTQTVAATRAVVDGSKDEDLGAPSAVVSGAVEVESESDNQYTVPNRLMLPKRRLILIAPFRFVTHTS